MKTILLRLPLFLCTCFFITNLSFGQTMLNGFFPEKGATMVSLSYTNKSYDQFYAGTELSDENPAGFGKVSSNIISLYGEHAFSNRLLGVINIPFISQSNENNVNDPVHMEDNVSGFQDLSLFLKAKLYETNIGSASLTTAVGGGIALPLGYESGGILSIGNGGLAFDGCLIAQLKTTLGLFLEGQFAYSLRGESDDFDVPNANLWNVKIGYGNQHFYLDAELGAQNSLDGTDIGTEEFRGPTSFPENQVDYTNLAFNLFKPITDNLGACIRYGTVLDGRNIGKNTEYKIGVIHKL